MITPTAEDLNQAGVVLRKYSPGVDSRWAIVKDVAQAIASAREAGEAKGRREAEERAEVTINKLARECNRLNDEKREDLGEVTAEDAERARELMEETIGQWPADIERIIAAALAAERAKQKEADANVVQREAIHTRDPYTLGVLNDIEARIRGGRKP